MNKTMMALLASVLALGSAAQAQADFPNQPIRMVLPFPPGGGTDALARIIGGALSEELGQQVLIDNRPGAAGNIASEYVARANPDGYTLLMGFSTALTVNPLIYPDLNFNIQRDFEPVTLLADAQYFLVVHPSVEAQTADELVAFAEAHPGRLNFSSSGVGSPLHLSAELFAMRTGIDIVHIPYGGGGPAAQAVLSGEVDMLFGSAAATVQHADAGNLRMLATTGSQRSELAPDTPTLQELGLEGFNVTAWYGLMAPEGTPAEVIELLHDYTLRALSRDDVLEALGNQGLNPIGGDAAALAALILNDTEMWAPVVEAADIRPGN